MSKLWLGIVKIVTWICQWQEKFLTAIYRAGFAILAMFVERFDWVKSIPLWCTYDSNHNLGGMLWSLNAICCMIGATIVDRRWFQSLAKVLMKSAHWTINNGGQQLHRCFQVGPPPHQCPHPRQCRVHCISSLPLKCIRKPDRLYLKPQTIHDFASN